MSDDSLITTTMWYSSVSHSASPTFFKRQWTNFNVDAFEMDVINSRLISCPPTNCKDYFICYDETLCELLDRYVPLKSSTPRRNNSALWFSSVCSRAKVATWRLEAVYRSIKTITVYRQSWIESNVQRKVVQTAYRDYWSDAFRSCPDSKTLWKKFNSLLEPAAPLTGPHSAEDFATYFTEKIDTI